MSKAKKDQSNEQVKVVLRRLPKYMTEKEVLEQISPLPDEVIGTYFRPANFAFDRSAYATLTLLFSQYCDSLVDFERRFDGYLFVDSRGNDSAAVVEAAVNQNFAACDCARIAEDTRVGAILTDKYYLEFCEKLEKEKAVPVMTLEQQIRRLGRPDDAKTQIGRLETPLVKYFFEKEAGKRRDHETRKVRRDEKKAAKAGKSVLDILMKPSTFPSSSTGSTSSALSKKETREAMTEKEKEKNAKAEAKRKERDALRKKKFLEEKKRKREERELLEGNRDPNKEPSMPLREQKKRERLGKPPRPSPAKTLSEQQGEDWIKKLTDPKATIKKKHDFPVTTKLAVLKAVQIPSTTAPSLPADASVTSATSSKSRRRRSRAQGRAKETGKVPNGPNDENRKPRL